MSPIELVHLFETEWLPRFKDIRHFTVEPVVIELCYTHKIYITYDQRLELSKFLLNYLKEHHTRFQYGGMSGFRVLKDAYVEPIKPAVIDNKQSPN